MDIKAIIGLGNPGAAYRYTRHNIGFRVVDELVEKHGGQWRAKDNVEYAEIQLHDKSVLVIKPQTFMNNSGAVVPALTKKGIKPENIVVIHDELELPFGKVAQKLGGSAKGHNGLKSIIAQIGDQFYRVRCGIGRPEKRDDVSDYVLSNFTEEKSDIEEMISKAVELAENLVEK